MMLKAAQASRYNILEIDFDLITYQGVIEMIERWRANGESHYVTFTNPYCVSLCHLNPQMYKATRFAGMTLPDGIGIILAAKLLGYPHYGRVTGPDMTLKLCDEGRKHGYRHYFYGGGPGIAEQLAERLSIQYPGLQVAGTYCPPFRPLTEQEDKDIVEKINSTNPDIVWIGLGAPKQEKWMAEHIGRIRATAMLGVGAAFDFHSGKVKWAPSWIRKLNLEGIYLIISNPSRARRKFKGDMFFAIRVLELYIKRKLGITEK